MTTEELSWKGTVIGRLSFDHRILFVSCEGNVYEINRGSIIHDWTEDEFKDLIDNNRICFEPQPPIGIFARSAVA